MSKNADSLAKKKHMTPSYDTIYKHANRAKSTCNTTGQCPSFSEFAEKSLTQYSSTTTTVSDRQHYLASLESLPIPHPKCSTVATLKGGVAPVAKFSLLMLKKVFLHP